MKKLVIVAIALLSLCLAGCNDKKVNTQYTIGCLGYQYGSIQGSDWEELESYFSSHVDYNKVISFESKSLAENDAKAKQHFEEQLKKIDTAYVCSLIKSTDYIDYGIATLNINGSYRNLKVVRFQESGMSVLEGK